MSGTLLDTHVLIWLIEGLARLGPRARQRADAAMRDDTLFVSALTFWEIATLAHRQHLHLGRPLAEWRRQVLGLGMVEVPVSGEIGILAAELSDFHADPADRIIVATAIMRDATLITADVRILAWSGSLHRHRALE